MPGILNRVGMLITTTGTGTVTANTAISNRFLTPAEAGAVNGQSYYWLLEEDQDFELFEGVWTLSGTTVSRVTVLKSKIGGVAGTTKMNLQGNATLRSPTPAEIFSTLFTAAGGTLTGALNWATAATVASASTADIGAAASNFVNITGTTTIAALGTIAQGAERIVKFGGALTLTHNATSLILPGGANITTAAGDTSIFVSEGSGNWRCIVYQRANGGILVGATAGEFWAGSNTQKPVTPKSVADASARVTLTSSTTIATDASLGRIFYVVLGHNATFSAPTNLIDGVTYTWIIKQDGTGSRTGAFNSVFRFPSAPTLSTAAGSVDIVSGIYNSTDTKIEARFSKGS